MKLCIHIFRAIKKRILILAFDVRKAREKANQKKNERKAEKTGFFFPSKNQSINRIVINSIIL